MNGSCSNFFVSYFLILEVKHRWVQSVLGRVTVCYRAEVIFCELFSLYIKFATKIKNITCFFFLILKLTLHDVKFKSANFDLVFYPGHRWLSG